MPHNYRRYFATEIMPVKTCVALYNTRYVTANQFRGRQLITASGLLENCSPRAKHVAAENVITEITAGDSSTSETKELQPRRVN